MKGGIFYSNVQSLYANKTQVAVFLQQYSPDIFLMTETHITEEIESVELHMPGYELFQCYSHSRHTGGVAAYVKKHIKCSIHQSICNNESNWILALNVKYRKENTLIVIVYHSPSESDGLFLKWFENWMEQNVKYEKMTIVAGDFNIDILKRSFYSDSLNKLIHSLGVKQLVKEPTRVTNTSQTLIDLVLINRVEFTADVWISPKIGDHSMIKINVNEDREIKNDKIKIKCSKNYSKDALCEKLSNVNWSETNDCDYDSKCDFIIDNVIRCVNELIEYKEKMVNSRNIWFEKDLKDLQKRKENLYEKAVYSNFEGNLWNDYKAARNEFNYALNRRKEQYFVKKLDDCNDQKQLWKMLKYEFIPSKTNNQKHVDFINFNQVKEDNPTRIVDKFNRFFVDSITEISNSIQTNVNSVKQSDYVQSDNTKSKFIFELVNCDSLKVILNKMNKKTDMNNLNSDIMLDSLEVVGDFLVQIINESLSNGYFPASWKESTVIPVGKKPNTKNCEEFRPINSMPLHEKLMEYTVKSQLQKFIL